MSSPSPSSGGHPLPWPWLDHPSPAQDTKCSTIIILSLTIIIRNISPHFENLISLNTHTICCEEGFTPSILWVSRQAQKGRDPSTVSQLTKVAVLGPEFKLSLTPTQGSYPSDVAASPMLTFPYHSLISSPPSPGSLPGLTQLSPAVRPMRYNPVQIVMMTQCGPVGVLEDTGWASLPPLLWECPAPLPASVETGTWTKGGQGGLNAISKALGLPRQQFVSYPSAAREQWGWDYGTRHCGAGGGGGCWLSRAALATEPCTQHLLDFLSAHDQETPGRLVRFL